MTKAYSGWTEETVALATMVASGVEEWSRKDVENCCELTGFFVTIRFLIAYEERWGLDTTKQIRQASEWHQPEGAK